MELEITDLAFGGKGVAREAGQVYLVAGALPGERVEAELLGRRRGVVEAVARSVLRPSPWREPDPCPLAGTSCGGCDFAHVASGFREQAFKASLAGALRGGPEALAEAVRQARFHASPWGYRLRGSLHWQPPLLGFFAPRSHRVTSLAPCRVLSPGLVQLLPTWEEALARSQLPPGELRFLEDLAGEKRLVGFRGPSPKRWPRLPGVEGFWMPGGRGYGERALELALPTPLQVPLGAFVQGNRFLLPRLWELAAQLVRGSGAKRVLDLYGGVGFFAAAAAAGGAQELTVVELSRLAAQAAKVNLPQAKVLPVAAEVAVGSGVLEGQELVILDPPRGGLSPTVRQAVAAARAESLLYLSCDPACLARDARELAASGWQVAWAELFDLFAGTHHGELAVLFRR